MKPKFILLAVAAFALTIGTTAQAQSIQLPNPYTIKKARLIVLNNQVGRLTAGQEAKAKLVIDQYVDHRVAAKSDLAKVVDLKKQYDIDINAILTVEQQRRLAASKAARIGD
jgi:hypothetical protein